MCKYRSPFEAVTSVGRKRIEKENSSLAMVAVAELEKLLVVASKAGLAQDVDVFFSDNIFTQLFVSRLGDGLFTRDLIGQLWIIKPLPPEDCLSFFLRNKIYPDDIIHIRRRIEAEIEGVDST